MAEIVLTIPDAQIGRAVTALCRAGGYSGAPQDGPARRAFAKAELIRFVRQAVMQAEREAAISAAMASVAVEPISID